jgi:arylsulfatase
MLAVLGCSAALALAACQQRSASEPTRPNLLLIVVDTLRADHLGCYGHEQATSPAIDALAGEGIRFERAYSSAPWTKPSVGSIMTGLHPSHHAVDRMLRVLPESAQTIADRLRENGYRTGGVISHSLLGKQYGFDQGFETYDESNARGHGYISTPNVTERALALMDELASSGEPFFLFVHFFDPHDTYRPHDGVDFAAAKVGRVRAGFSSPRLRVMDPPPNREEVGLLQDVYDEEIWFTDRGIERLLNELRRLRLIDQTLVVLTADHGEEFLERGWLGHGSSLYEELLHVPLIMRLPGGRQAGTVRKDPVSLVGVAATIFDVLGIEVDPDNWDVGSFLEPAPEAVPIRAELNYIPKEIGKEIPKDDDPWLRAVIEGDFKLIYDRVENRARLFNIAEDPGETNDLAAAMPERAERMRTLIGNGPRPDDDRRLHRKVTTLTEEQKEILRKLGYGGDD